MNSLITIAGRSKMAKARAGEIQLPPVVGIVLGDGGVDADNIVINPTNTLNHEILRKVADSITKVSDTSYRYSINLSKTDLIDAAISEMALYDSEGDLVAIKNFKPKYKDAEMEMTFEMDDTF